MRVQGFLAGPFIYGKHLHACPGERGQRGAEFVVGSVEEQGGLVVAGGRGHVASEDPPAGDVVGAFFDAVGERHQGVDAGADFGTERGFVQGRAVGH